MLGFEPLGACHDEAQAPARTVGVSQTVAKVKEQGIDAMHLHDDSVCYPRGLTSEKAHEIRGWIYDHRLKPLSDHPRGRDDHTIADLDAWEIEFRSPGFEFLAIDDDMVALAGDVPQVKTDFADGFTVAAYRAACTFLNAADLDFHVHPVSQADMMRVVGAFGGDRVAAAVWLQASPEYGYAHATELNVERLRQLAKAYHQIRDIDAWVSALRDAVWGELARHTQPLDDDLDAEPPVAAR